MVRGPGCRRAGGRALTRAALILLAGLPLLACFVASIVLLRLDERHRALRARRLQVAAAHRAERFTQVAASAPRARHNAVQAFLGRVLARTPNRSEPYRFALWVVIPVALLPGLMLRWLLHGLLGHAAWLLVPAAWLFCVRAVHRNDDNGRRSTLLRQFPDALGTVVRAVRVGIPVGEAMRGVAEDAPAPTAAEFARVHDQIGIGTLLEDALLALSERSGLPEYRFFAMTLALQSRTGGGLTETLENLADVIRKRVALKARGFALAAEARTSAGVLAVLPVFAGCALLVMNPAYIKPLFAEGSGQTLLGIAVCWLGLGLLSMRWLIRKSLS